EALSFFEVDSIGLDKIDRKILFTLIEKFGGSPVGLNTLAVSIGEDQQTIEEVYEPYLLQLGMIKRTPRGRVATQTAYNHLGIKSEGKLF
ncbi:MAG: Holliday junction branch migration DNA helicase RuvB, partial [Actinomycetia bacterium]|nr:Holliday junction branch migration DNA helicase RuvB [Actinomycetes bacterium]